MKESDLYSAMKNMINNKSHGNDGLTKEFYEIFWDEIIDLTLYFIMLKNGQTCFFNIMK